MATLVLTAAATAAGAAVGGPLGGIAGNALSAGASYVGNMVDSKIFGGKLPEARGPRLADLSVQTSTFGKMIPVIYGSMRVAGNIIWSRPIKETITTSTASAGGKGGTGQTISQTQSTYSYSVTMAVAICEGAIDEVQRVWADALLLDLSQGTYRIYKGDEAQGVDTLIESFEGVGQTPAYRGLAYVVIEDFPLAAFGNRIPNFTFEVKKKVAPNDDAGQPLENLIKSVVFIPGSGEFVYDTTVQSKVVGEAIGDGWAQQGAQTRINQNNNSGIADSLVALDQLLATCKNIEWVALVVTWFGDSLDAGDCTILPGVEYQEGATTAPDQWSVGDFTRDTARQITLDDNGNPVYGGTPNDAGILRYLDEIRARGLKIMFYPLFFMDVENKPWRGRVTGEAAEVADFFTKANGYNAFVTHYANLVADKVDGFIIGSEMIGLTKVYTGTTTRTYPAVDALVSLAGSVRSILGSGVKLTYAADWSEYHHTDDGWYNLDPLWASADIDFVGIDAYFPLTSKARENYDVEEAIDGWTSGEGYDFYYTDSERTTTASLTAPYAWKNIDWWWNNTHTNPDSSVTSWTSKMKKIWFTEYGFPSVDCATNQPNVFYDPNSIESYFPYHSRGRIDFKAQRIGLIATEKQWKDSLMVENKFIWTWDARPFPFWPDLTNIWTDGRLWKYGHWIEGKLGVSNLGAIVADLCYRAGLSDADFDVSRLTETVDGYILTDQVSARAAIETLQLAFFFDAVESDGIIKFVPRANDAVTIIDSANLVRMKEGEAVLNITRAQEIELPQKIDVNYINFTSGYHLGNQHSERLTTDSREKYTISLPIAMADQAAKNIADISLFNNWTERTGYQFYCPSKYSYLEPTDVIEIAADSGSHTIRITEALYSKAGVMKIKGVAEDITVYDFYNKPGFADTQAKPVMPISPTDLEILDIPALPTDQVGQAPLRFAALGVEENWPGTQIFRSDNGGGSYANLLRIDSAAVMGIAATELADGNCCFYDRINTVTVILQNGELESIDDESLLNGGNTALLGNEIIQFKYATLLDSHKYEVSYLIRGRLGTEAETTTHSAGERFVLLDANVVKTSAPLAIINLSRKYKAATFGTDLSYAQPIDFTFTGKSLKPYSPVSIYGERDGSGNLTISWKRRTRIGGEWKDYSDVPLAEEKEEYEAEILDGSDVLRTIKGLSSPEATYSAADQTIDFGSAQSSVSVKVYQMSAVVGRGNPGDAIV